MHVNPPLGGGLQGTAANARVVPDVAELLLAQRAFAVRAATAAAAAASSRYARGATWSGAGIALTAPATDVAITCQATGIIQSVILIGIGGTGSAVVDIWKTGFTGTLPTVANTITASAKPTLSSAVEYQDTTLTGWTTAVTKGDVLLFHLVSVSIFTALTVLLEIA